MSIPARAQTYSNDFSKAGEPCVPEDGYDDISTGAQVTVSDASGAKVAIGSLTDGLSDNRNNGTPLYSYCTFGFSVPEVPEGQGLFSIHVGNTNRGDVTFKRIDLDGGVQLTIGD